MNRKSFHICLIKYNKTFDNHVSWNWKHTIDLKVRVPSIDRKLSLINFFSSIINLKNMIGVFSIENIGKQSMKWKKIELVWFDRMFDFVKFIQ